jgi:hypothetical protein
MLLLLAHAATLFMTGLVRFVQVVHYPLFAQYARLVSTNWIRTIAWNLRAGTALAMLNKPQ